MHVLSKICGRFFMKYRTDTKVLPSATALPIYFTDRVLGSNLTEFIENTRDYPFLKASSLVQLSSLQGSVLNTSVQPFFSFAICSRGSVMGGVSLALICRISQLNASVDYTWQQPDTDKWLSKIYLHYCQCSTALQP